MTTIVKTTRHREKTSRMIRRYAILGTVAALAAAAMAPGTADARKIANPSPPDYYAEITGGYLQLIGSNGSPLGLSLDFESAGYPKPSLRGTVASDGTVNFPKAQVVFAPLAVPLGTDTVNLSIQPTANWTGKIDALTGRFDLDAPFRIQATGSAQGIALGGNCYLGSASNPLTLKVRTHLGTFPAVDSIRSTTFVADGSTLGGLYNAEPYSDESGLWASGPALDNLPLKARPAGSARTLDDNFAVPGASGCGPLNLADSQINSQLGLPAPAGSSRAVIDVAFVPGGTRVGSNSYVNRAVAPKITASGLTAGATWPSTEVPELPTAVAATLDGSTSYFAAGPNSAGKFQWDNGSGTFGSFTNSTTQVISFEEPGLKTVRLTARDVDGDFSTATRQINVVRSTDIALASSVPAGDFRGGSNGVYSYTVSNVSTDRANTQPITLTTTLPAGVSYVSAAGADWSCGASGSTVTCTLPTGRLAAEASSEVSLTVAVAATAGASVDNSASIAQAGDPESANNTASLSTAVRRTDLTVTNTKNGNFTANGVWGYELDVSNVGDAATVGDTTVTVTLPEGMTYTSNGSGGTGWTCSRVGTSQDVSCVTSAEVSGNSGHAALLTVRGRIATTVSGTISSSATVSTQGDVNAFSGANTDGEDAEVAVVPDLAIYSSHSGSFIVGDPGTYTVRVDNESVLDAAGPTNVAYDLPAGLKVSSATGTGWDCSATTAGSSRVECSYADTIAAGASSSDLSVTVSVGHAGFPSTNHAPVVSNSNDGYAPNDTGADATSVKRLNIGVTQAVAKAFSVGVEGIYRISVTNNGDAATVGTITALSNLPSSVKLKNAAGPGWDCTRSLAQKILCTRSASLGVGVTAGVITARVDVLDQAGDDGQVENTVSVSTERDDNGVEVDAPVSGDNSSTITTKAVSVDLAASVSHPGDVLVGTKLTVGIKIRNVGTFPTVKGETVVVTDQLPDGITPVIGEVWTDRAGWSCEADGTLVTCTLTPADSNTSAMNVSDTATIEVPVIATDEAAEEATNTVTVSTLKDSSVEKSPNNQGLDSLNVRRIDIDLSASQSIAPRAGGIGEVTVGVTNSGSNTTTGPVEVTIPLPNGVSYRAIGSTTAGWACGSAGAGTSVVCSRTPALAAGATAPQLKVRTYNSTAAPDSWESDVTATTASEDSGLLGDNTATISATLQKVDLQLVKSHPGSNVRAGSRATFRLRVNNLGNLASSGAIRVSDTLDPVFSRIAAHGTGWTCSVTGQTVNCATSASVAAGGRAADITVGADIPTEASGTYESNPIAAMVHDGDPYPSNNSSTDPTSITTTQDLALASSPLGSFRIGSEATIRYKVTNVGSEIADGSPIARISDELPVGLVAVSSTSDHNWECDFGAEGRDLDCDLTSEYQNAQAAGLEGEDLDGLSRGLQPGESSVLNVRVRVTGDAAAQIGSIARVRTGAAGQDPNRTNDAAVGVYDIGGVDLAITDATPSTTTFETGRASRFTLNVSNVGDAPTLGTSTVTVPLSKGSSFNDTGVFGTGWDCRLVADDIRCERQDVLAPGESAAPLQLAIVPGTSDLPNLETTFTVSTDGDERTSNNSVTRDDPITDLTPAPDTTITNGPPLSTTANTAKIEFESSDPDSAFECILDGAAPASCSSPLNLSGLALGPHVLTITAIGSTGKREEEPANFAWTVRKAGGNRTPLTATMKTGVIDIPSLGALPLPADQLTLVGDVGEDGSWSVPTSGIKFPVIAQDVDASGIKARIKVIITSSAGGAGEITPGGGAANFAFPAKIKAEATLAGPSGGFDDGLVILGPSSQCFLQPINFNLTGTYDRNADTVTLAQTGVAIPKTSAGCGSLGATVDGALGLPRTDAAISVSFLLGGGVKVGVIRSQATTRAMSVPVLCRGLSTCGGQVQVIGRILSGGKYRTVVLSRKGYSLKRGKGANVQLGFSNSVRKVIEKAGKSGVKVTVQVIANGTKKPAATGTVTLRR